MCDMIEYEEVDRKEKIVKELRHMLLDGDSKTTDNISSDINLVKPTAIIIDRDRIYNKDKVDTSGVPPISKLYSQFSKNIHEKIMIPPEEKPVNKEIVDINEDNKDDLSDLSDLCSYKSSDDDEIGNVSSKPDNPKSKMVDSSCLSNLDETILQKSNKPKLVDSGSLSLLDEKNTLLTSSLIAKPPPRKLVESSGNSTFDHEPIKNATNLSNVNRKFNFKRSQPEQISKTISKGNTCTMATETDEQLEELASNNPAKLNQNFAGQADNIYHDIEQKIVPFVQNPHTIELKLRGRLSVFQKACVKQIADQNKLFIKHFGKGKDSFVLLRKKVQLLETQKVFLEMKKAEKENKIKRVAELKAKQERLLNPPKMVTSSCQVDVMSEDEESVQELSKSVKKKLRQQAKKQKLKKSSYAQTAPDGFYVCQYCEDDIPESLQHIHYPFCLQKYRSSLQNGTNTQIKPQIHQTRSRSKSQERRPTTNQQKKLGDMKKQLTGVHDNDINQIIKTIKDLEKQCSVEGCEIKKFKTCEDCNKNLCSTHYNPNTDSPNVNDEHFNCPVILERSLVARSKKLGQNNPLLKTPEELRKPVIPNGLAARNRRRPQSAQSASLIGVNKTNFERQALKNRLKERISYLNDKRSK